MGKFPAHKYIYWFHKFSLGLIMAWLGKIAFVAAVIVGFWVMHDTGAKPPGVFNFGVVAKTIAMYLFRVLAKISFLYALMLIFWGLNYKEWVKYINEKKEEAMKNAKGLI